MPVRYLCDVLEEMRECYKTRNFAGLLGLIAEAQTLANRMEAGLTSRKNYKYWNEKRKEEQKSFNELRKEADKLRKAQGKPVKGSVRH